MANDAKSTNRGWHVFLSVVTLIGIGFLGWMALSVQQVMTNQAAIRTQITQLQLATSGISSIRDRVANNHALLLAQQAEIAAASRRITRLEQGSDAAKRWTK